MPCHVPPAGKRLAGTASAMILSTLQAEGYGRAEFRRAVLVHRTHARLILMTVTVRQRDVAGTQVSADSRDRTAAVTRHGVAARDEDFEVLDGAAVSRDPIPFQSNGGRFRVAPRAQRQTDTWNGAEQRKHLTASHSPTPNENKNAERTSHSGCKGCSYPLI